MFSSIGRFPVAPYDIKLEDGYIPVIHSPRSVPCHLLPLYEKEIESVIQQKIITPVTEPTEWVNSIVVNVTKNSDGSNKVRLCLDPRDLNKYVKTEHHYSRSLDEILPFLSNKCYISLVDMKKGF